LRKARGILNDLEPWLFLIGHLVSVPDTDSEALAQLKFESVSGTFLEASTINGLYMVSGTSNGCSFGN
jgi:hypothetical protein